MPPIPVNLPPRAAPGGTPYWPDLVEQIGRPGFAAALLGVCRDVVGASDLALFVLRAGAPELLGAASLRGQAAQRCGRHYLRQAYYRLDTNLRVTDAAVPQLCMSRLHVAELPDLGYRAACYESAGLAERLSVLIPAAGAWLFVNAYRTARCATPAEAAFEHLRGQVPLIAAAVRRHAALQSGGAEVDRSALDALSARERQVVQAILEGLNAKEAARRLGVAATSIATYRQRAFEKLGLRRQVELFQRFGGSSHH
ncbi:MAG: LuxR family transcriptional regulator [Burkholderiales bacterium]|nr:LuxR family transcriptional regulator [Burkholderiales bacterium]MDE2398345.1 LuxR family transcriptional regulator [Burkholderiales bacterium]